MVFPMSFSEIAYLSAQMLASLFITSYIESSLHVYSSGFKPAEQCYFSK